MEPITIILITAAALAVVALAFMSGWELGQASAKDTAITPRRPTVAELVNELKPRRPKAAKNRRKAARKAVRL